MMTHLAYFEDTYKFKDQAILMASSKDENGPFLILDQTIFYPQGGGQPSDHGKIEMGNLTVPIHKVKSISGEIRHYTDQNYNFLIGQTVMCLVDEKTRLLHARLHTSGHLIANMMESLFPQWVGVKGHHFPGECYVEFISKHDASDDLSIDFLNQEIQKVIAKDYLTHTEQAPGDKLQTLCPNLPYNVPRDKPIRLMRIGDFPFSPCGGTHVKSLKELGGLEVTKVKIKQNIMKIYYV